MLSWRKKLYRARKAASKRGLEATLTVNDWNQTCADMDYRCAYCGNTVLWDATIDHFQPMALGGGTTIGNCVLSCRPCNNKKGELCPEIFLIRDSEKLVRLQYYLARRQAVKGHYSFWSFSLPKGHCMNKDEMQLTPFKLDSGTELRIYNNDENTVLQLRQPTAENDPLATSIQTATQLTLSECLALAGTLLSCAASKVEKKQLLALPVTPAPAYPW